MDLTEKILKLVSLGWDGKEDELDFFKRVYNISIDQVYEDGKLYVTISFTDDIISHKVRIRKKKANIDPIRYCLRFFRTKDGIVIGPKADLFLKSDQDWT